MPTVRKIEVRDSAQLTRIESVHRGFFYQHLYAVACLLNAEASGVRVVDVETDEDIELQTDHERWYVQVKTRATALKRRDITKVLHRFEELRALHTAGERALYARFAIVANVEPSVDLVDSLPSDVTLITPCRPPAKTDVLPPATIDVPDALATVAAISSTVPLSRLAGETLALKLASLVQMAASGSYPFTDHRFDVSDLPAIFEQIAIQLQNFPAVDPMYEAQQNEPSFEMGKKVRFITAISGGGKSAWAAQAAISVARNALYFDVGDAPVGTVAAFLAREFTGKLAAQGADVRPAILPGRSGVDSLRALDILTRDQQAPVAVFVDNAHRIDFEELRAIVAALPNQHLIVLGQPCENLNALAILLDTNIENLEGWSLTTIAKVFSRYGAPIDVPTADRVRAVTGAMPLYVKQAAELTSRDFGGDADALCESLAKGTHTQTTAQETILRRAIEMLNVTTRVVVAAATVSDVPLQGNELLRLSQALATEIQPTERDIRTATDHGLLLVTTGGQLVLHDAFRLPARELIEEYGGDVSIRLLTCLRAVMEESLGNGGDTRRLSLLLRTLAELGDTSVLLDAITTEFFHEFGLAHELEHLVLDALNRPNLSSSDRFWSLDTLAFWRLQNSDVDGSESFVKQMANETKVVAVSRGAATALATKHMLIAAYRGKRRNLSELSEMLCG